MMPKSTVPAGYALRLLLLAWSLDHPEVPQEPLTRLTAQLLQRDTDVPFYAYRDVAASFRQWGRDYGLVEVIDRAIEQAVNADRNVMASMTIFEKEQTHG